MIRPVPPGTTPPGTAPDAVAGTASPPPLPEPGSTPPPLPRGLSSRAGSAASPPAPATAPGAPVPAAAPSWHLPEDPTAARRARQVTRCQLLAWELNDHCETAELLVSELVTNALSHGRGPIRLGLGRRHGMLRCEVADHGRGLPQPRPLSMSGESGRGMHLVDALTNRWGVDHEASGKTVWFELATCTAPDCCTGRRPA